MPIEQKIRQCKYWVLAYLAIEPYIVYTFHLLLSDSYKRYNVSTAEYACKPKLVSNLAESLLG